MEYTICADTRRKNVNWKLAAAPKEPGWEGAQLAVLMDIRDELQRLNGLITNTKKRRRRRVKKGA